jgi:hypothetical protein
LVIRAQQSSQYAADHAAMYDKQRAIPSAHILFIQCSQNTCAHPGQQSAHIVCVNGNTADPIAKFIIKKILNLSEVPENGP